MQSSIRQLTLTIRLSSARLWKRSLATIMLLATLLLTGCAISFASSSSISDSGNPVVITNQFQVIYVASNCNGPVAITVPGGTNLVDIGPANSSCEQIVYPSESGYTQGGCVPVYSIHRANNAVLCVYHSGCNLRAGPSSSAAILFTLPFGQRVPGRGTDSTGAIITDGNNYSWWQVVCPSTGQIADIYGIFTVAF